MLFANIDCEHCRYIMSDCDAVALIHEFIDYAPTPEDAVSDVMLAGTSPTHVLKMELSCLFTKMPFGMTISKFLRNRVKFDCSFPLSVFGFAGLLYC